MTGPARHITNKFARIIRAAGLGAACALLQPATALADEGAPALVSVDYCADQFVLALAEPSQIIALSKDARTAFSFYYDRAKGIPSTRGTVEDILLKRPDALVKQWFGTPAADRLYARAGIESISIGFADTPEGNFDNLIAFADKIGRRAAAEDFVSTRQAMIAALKAAADARGKALYVTPGGFSAGTGTFVNRIITLAGFDTMADTYDLKGWGPLPLEAIVQNPPDVIITSFYDLMAERSRWSAAQFPVIENLLADKPVIDIPSRFLSCSGLFAADAATLIRRKAADLGLAAPLQ